MAKDFGFTQDAAQRIVDATRAYERGGPPTTRTPASPSAPQPVRMWVSLTGGVALTASQYRYGFVRVIPDATKPNGFTCDTNVTGSDCVFDPNMLLSGIGANINDRIVVIELVGHRPPDDPETPNGPIYWIVSGGGGGADSSPWVHDHRDNNAENGGFAFSVYHPGTQLPQIAFAN